MILDCNSPLIGHVIDSLLISTLSIFLLMKTVNYIYPWRSINEDRKSHSKTSVFSCQSHLHTLHLRKTFLYFFIHGNRGGNWLSNWQSRSPKCQPPLSAKHKFINGSLSSSALITFFTQSNSSYCFLCWNLKPTMGMQDGPTTWTLNLWRWIPLI